MKEQFEARMLRIYFGEADKWQGQPLQEAILGKCRELGLAGATVFRGIEGYGSSTRVRRERVWKLSRDAPMMITVVDTEAQIEKLLPHLDGIVGEGLIAVSKVEVIRYTRSETKAKSS